MTLKSIEPKPAWQNVIVIVYTTLILVLDYYRTLLKTEIWDRFVFYLCIPLLLLWAFRRSPADSGLSLGRWRRGIWMTLGGCALVAPILGFVAQTEAMRVYYAHIWRVGGLSHTLAWAIQDLLGWEFFFRGFLLFSLAEICGKWAILLQAVPFTLGHLGKPEIETLSCILGGSAFGWLAWETESFLYPFLLHVFVAVFTVWVTTL